VNPIHRLASALLAASVLALPAGIANAQTTSGPPNAAPLASPQAEHRPGMRKMMESLNLTDAQKSQIQQIVQTARQQNENADPQTRHANMRKAWDQIKTQVLTADQRSQLDAEVKAYRDAHPNGAPKPAPSPN
jgi:Spy/CpxP family protein refolding chaperone